MLVRELETHRDATHIEQINYELNEFMSFIDKMNISECTWNSIYRFARSLEHSTFSSCQKKCLIAVGFQDNKMVLRLEIH